MSVCLSAAAVWGAAACRGAGTTLKLAERGKPAAYAVVCPEGASESQRYAAEELRRFTEEMTGVRLPIVSDRGPLPPRAILLGKTRHTAGLLKAPPDGKALGTDGFRLAARPPHLLVLGGPARGALYGVYELLERFGGCRWYASWHSVIPRRETFGVPADLDDAQTPAFAMREPFWFDMFDGDFAARCRANGNAMRLEAKHGGRPFRFGGGLGSCHTFNKLCPPEEFFDKHPEYFSEVNGKRVKNRTQLCLTNPDVLKIVTRRVLERIRKDPGAKFYGVSQNDWGNYCTCPACKAVDDREGSHAGTMIAFVNAVAEAVEKEFPDAVIETLAYQYTRRPPKTLRVRRNVVPCLCTIECEFSRGLKQSPYHQNRSFVRDIRGWAAMTDRLYVWDYTTNFRHYTAPFPNVLTLQDNVKFFRENRVAELFEQGAYQGRHGDFAELKAWLLAKWMWNPDLPREPLLKDFFNGYYGAAAPFVRAYFDELHRFHRDPLKAPLRIYDDVRDPVIPDAFYERAAALWRQAEAAVKGSPAHLYNVRMGAFPVLYARLARLPAFSPKTVWVTRHPERFGPSELQKTLAAELTGCMKEAKNIRLSESRVRNQEELGRWEKILRAPAGRPADSAVVEDGLLRLSRKGEWCGFTADPLAGDGSAIKFFNTHYEWCARLPFSCVAFDPGATYKIRARIRVEKKPGRTGEAFWAGVYDAKNKRGAGFLKKTTDETGDGYAWYDVASWTPGENHYFWIGPGRFDRKKGESAIRALYLDKLEIIRVNRE